MTENHTTITVEDVRKLALPLGTHVITGDGLLTRPVAWTTVIYPEDNYQAKSLQANELLLIAPDKKRNRGADHAVELVRWAAEQQAAALVFSDTTSPTAIAEAKSRNLPVLALSKHHLMRSVEKNIISLLVDRGGQIERRGTQIYRQLTQISSSNEGITELINAIARLTNKAVVLQDKRLRIIVSTVQPQFVSIWDEVETFLGKLEYLPVELQNRHQVATMESPTVLQALSTQGIARLVAPIVTNGVGRGFLSVVGHEEELDDVDLLVTEHGAEACAVEMAKQKAVSETEKRLRGTFLDRLLLGDVSKQEAIRQGERFDHDMIQTHIAIVTSWRGNNPLSARRLETMVNSVIESQRSPSLVWQREKEGEVVIFHATQPDNPIDASLNLAEAISKTINRQFPQNRVAIGLGQPARDIGGWRSSYRDAVQAMELAVRLQTDTPLYIGDLGVYQLILGLDDRKKLLDFCNQTLGSLTEYDMRQNADLVKTLEAFFNCHGNLSQTAESLIVHRNTLLYRMNRINEIAEIDLNRPETRLALHLALTIRRLLAIN